MDSKTMNPHNPEFQTEQEKFWLQEFGDEYTHRNQGKNSIAGNLALFSQIFSRTKKFNSLIEFGANRGLNIEAIKQLLPEVKVSAIEINHVAVEELQKMGGVR
ncbi:hypothetical protein JJD41_12315 [Oxynema sp. CENA135]|uniref:hypothetical protein n=1 Tax=Oxynema sp. CENA135 TaxID=984206 RepID=UPI00190C8688|nr:hypothetical protein [Oxynema sp. CENA135]MBK4730642.1 hypothetical protein [Oxynema sp. CENA135]